MPRGSNLVELAGRRFGKLVVSHRVGSRRYNKGQTVLAVWRVKCDCGKELDVLGASLRSGNSTSCGCKRGDAGGLSWTGTYRSWKAMIERCEDPRSASYKNYGRLGVRVCERWHDFKAFMEDMGERQPGTTLDRIDPTKNYEPGNCRWADAKTQRANRRPAVVYNPFLSTPGGTREWTWIA